jgi:hypothetical protein
LAIVTLAFGVTLRSASLSINGTRYFWLDDDQMISMRYARNLAHGDGLVWNPGERVEGYTNPGWTLVMAGLHLLPISDAKMAVAVKAVSWLLACWILILAERLTTRLLPDDDLAPVFVLITLALCRDLLFWAVNGFDTTLLTAVFLCVLVRLLEERDRAPRALTYILLGTLPVIRSDAYYVWAGAAIMALGLSRERTRTASWLAMSLALPAAHVGWRRWYYQEWLPNTYFVKVSGVAERFGTSTAYLKDFVYGYAALLSMAVVGAFRDSARSRRWLLAPGVCGIAYVCLVGADMYSLTRYLAYFIPVLVVLAAAGVNSLEAQWRPARAAVLVSLALSMLFQIGINGKSQFLRLASLNGEPQRSVVTAIAILDNTRPTASVAVVAAGIVPYFSHRPAFDILGLSDRHVSHGLAHPGEAVGHTKYDPEYTLGQHPDVLAPLWDCDEGRALPSTQSTRTQAIVASSAFAAGYRGRGVEISTPDGPSWIYVEAGTSAANPTVDWRHIGYSR